MLIVRIPAAKVDAKREDTSSRPTNTAAAMEWPLLLLLLVLMMSAIAS
jgi:hypothetical protein